MTQHLEPLFGAFSTDQAIARAIGLQPGITAKPVFQATGGSGVWSGFFQVNTALGFWAWRTPWTAANGSFTIMEDTAVQLFTSVSEPIVGLARNILIVGRWNWVAGATDSMGVPLGTLSTPQLATYEVVSGSDSATPTDPIVAPLDSLGRPGVVLARIVMAHGIAPAVQWLNRTMLDLAELGDMIANKMNSSGDVVHSGGLFQHTTPPVNPTDIVRLMDLNGAISAAFFKGAPAATGGGNYQSVVFVAPKSYGDGASIRDPQTVGLLKPGLYEVIVTAKSSRFANATNIAALKAILTYTGTSGAQSVVLDEAPDTMGDDEDQTVYAILYVDSSWGDPYITVYRDGNYPAAIQGSVKYLGDPGTLPPMAIATSDKTFQETVSQSWPDSADITLTADNPAGAVAWTLVSGVGLLTTSGDPYMSISGNIATIHWTTNPGTPPKNWAFGVQAQDSARLPRVVQKTINVTLNAYSVVALAITTGDLAFALTGSGPFSPNFTAAGTGGTTPYTWALVAGADTTLPGASINSSTGTVTSSVTYTQMNAGPYKVRVRCTDSAGSPAVIEKVINITTSATSGGGGGGGGGGGCPAPDVMIEMWDGTEKGAGDIRVGDAVTAWDEAEGVECVEGVIAVKADTNQRMRLVLANGRAGSFSENHRFLMESGEWRELHTLALGDILHGGAAVEAVLPDSYGTVVKITVNRVHTFVTMGVVSHNVKFMDGL